MSIVLNLCCALLTNSSGVVVLLSELQDLLHKPVAKLEEADLLQIDTEEAG